MQEFFLVMMEHVNKTWDKILPTENELLIASRVENSTNPTDRLKHLVNGKNYYQIRKQEIMHSWGYWFGNNTMEPMPNLNLQFTNELTELHECYKRDLKLWLEHKKACDNILLLKD
jgi:hypothetical protein